MREGFHTPFVAGTSRLPAITRARRSVLFRHLVSVLLLCCLASTYGFTLVPVRSCYSCNQQWAWSDSCRRRREKFTLQSAPQEDMMDEYERQSQAFRQDAANPSDFFTPKDETSSPSSFPRRVKTRLNNLLSGMPSLTDMFRAADEQAMGTDATATMATTNQSPSKSTVDKSKSRRPPPQDPWFQDEKQEIVEKYDAMYAEMKARLALQANADPDSVPENAQALMQFIFQEEMERELVETRDKRAKERIQQYGDQKREELEQQNLDDVPVSEDLQILLDETEQDLQRRGAARREKEDFYRYEREALNKNVNDNSIPAPVAGTNMDLWALDRLEEMAETNSEGEGSQGIVDLLEESAERLRDRLDRQSKKSSIRPESMKEWQMYRSIDTRLASDMELLGSTEDDPAREEEVKRRLDAWKAYIEREDSIRKELGLTRGPKLPFDWHEVKSTELEAGPAEPTNRTRVEIRKEINRKSVQALESLLTTVSPSRRENLQKEIAFMKSVLEPNDYLDVEETSLDEKQRPKLTGPVDLRDVFTSPAPLKSQTGLSISKEAAVIPSFGLKNEPVYESRDVVGPAVSDRPLPPPPNTPFFSQELAAEAAPVDSKLGDMEEQKLQSMFRKADARTREEQDRIRGQYEEYKRLEDEARQKSGLKGDGSADESNEEKSVDVAAYLSDDGTIDAEKLLKSIGPRPSRSKKTVEQVGTELATEQSTIGQREVVDSLFRSVSAVGGGRYKDDPEEAAKMRASYEDFVQKEKALRESLDEADAAPSSIASESFDDVKYAESVLNSLGPRPKVRRAGTIDEGVISDRGGVLAWEGEELDDDDDEEETSDQGTIDDNVPGWLRQESEKEAPRGLKGQLLTGGNINEAFDDDQYDKRVRQLHEYEQRRGRRRQIGIDPSDLFGRRGSDDYADYKFDDENFRSRQGGWGDISFLARKESLLDYIELDAAGLNSLMDHKDSVYSTGVSQYLPRVNKPFSCFGAIFHLEGVLVDLTGLQLEAWTKVAAEFGFRAPEYDDVLMASVLRPDIALKEAFFWTNDAILIRDAAATHSRVFRELFDQWARGQGVALSQKSADTLVIGAEVMESVQVEDTGRTVSEGLIGSTKNSWLETAETYGKPVPSQSDLFKAASLDPERAVIEAFHWTNDPSEAARIVATYDNCLKFGRTNASDSDSTQLTSSSSFISMSPPASFQGTQGKRVLDENAVMELHYHAWQSVAKSFGFTAPDSDAVLSAFVISEPSMAITHVFCWTDDQALGQKVAAEFRKLVDASLEAARGATEPPPPTVYSNQQPSEASTETGFKSPVPVQSDRPGTQQPATLSPSYQGATGPNQDDVFRTAFDGWKAVALKEGKSPPNQEQVLFAMSVGPESAVVSGFEWAKDFREAARFVELYLQEIAVLRQRWDNYKESAPAVPQSVSEIAPVTAAPGAAKWIESLMEVEMPCAIVSFLESDQVEALLQYAGLASLFPMDRRVTWTNGYKDDVQQLLGAALRVERRPDHCVVFDASPHASRAAHEIDMRNVNIIGHFPKYELLTADSTTASFTDMTAMDIRRLFSERVFDQPQTESLQPIVGAGTMRKTKTKSGFWDED